MTQHEGATWLALLRGINVGGRNIIRMADLRHCFESGGFRDVTTYIQSGNVIFRSPVAQVDELTARIREMLATAFDYTGTIALRSRQQLRTVVDGAPTGFGAQPDAFRYDVIFLIPPLAPDAALEHVLPRPGVDEVWSGDGVLYYSRLIAKASQSQLGRLASKAVYRSMTIRNWRTTTRLLGLMAE